MDRLSTLNADAASEVMTKSGIEEGWQKRALAQPYTRYALGSMQEVGSDYTRISLDTAERVGNQLLKGLDEVGIPVEFRIQGSVPLNVHIRGVSDVDLLTLQSDFLTYDTGGQFALKGQYGHAGTRTSLGVLQTLRAQSERILAEKFPAATVNHAGGKAIAISGGSLARPVDVVPSHWFDTIAYQAFKLERDRGVTILDKKVPETLKNWPFLYIHRIDEHDRSAGGCLKKAIRLCKNVKSDAKAEGRSIVFPSFDIAATLFHADLQRLRLGIVYELAVLSETQRFLDELYHDEKRAKSLWVPDGSRPIFDTDEKYAGLRALSVEIDDLALEVAKEQSQSLRNLPNPSLSDSRRVLNEVYIPG